MLLAWEEEDDGVFKGLPKLGVEVVDFFAVEEEAVVGEINKSPPPPVANENLDFEEETTGVGLVVVVWGVTGIGVVVVVPW